MILTQVIDDNEHRRTAKYYRIQERGANPIQGKAKLRQGSIHAHHRKTVSNKQNNDMENGNREKSKQKHRQKGFEEDILCSAFHKRKYNSQEEADQENEIANILQKKHDTAIHSPRQWEQQGGGRKTADQNKGNVNAIHSLHVVDQTQKQRQDRKLPQTVRHLRKNVRLSRRKQSANSPQAAQQSQGGAPDQQNGKKL